MTDTIQTLANQLHDSLIARERDNGDKFLAIAKDSAEWMQPVIMAAHDAGEMLPNDERYQFISDALSSIAESDDTATLDDLRDSIHQWADSDTDVYNYDLFSWLSSNLQRQYYVDEFVETFGHSEQGISGDIMGGQFMERCEVYNQLIDALESLIDE